ncbi:metal ABC transporter permease [Rhodococcus rhodnii]|nr:metal ABC transporter permease [Rhodococcus rhodnii]TXG92574.1 metal ABC transporter permease [Rhodococcus rhodnii]
MDPALLLEPFRYGFMVRAFTVAVVTAIVCGLLSCWLVLVGWSLLGDAVSHAVLPGVVLAYIAGAPFALGALVFGIVAVALIGAVRDTSRIKEDAAIGIVFTTLFALGLVLVSVTPSQIDLGHIVFGNVLGVSTSDLVQVLVLSAIVFVVLVAGRRAFTLFAFDPAHAHAIGMRPRVISAVLLASLAVTAVAALQSVGVVLVVAMLVIPGATAHLWTDRFGRMMIVAPTVSALSAAVGVYISYFADTASGATIVLVLGGVFAVSYLFAPRHGLLGRVTHRRRPGRAQRAAAT